MQSAALQTEGCLRPNPAMDRQHGRKAAGAARIPLGRRFSGRSSNRFPEFLSVAECQRRRGWQLSASTWPIAAWRGSLTSSRSTSGYDLLVGFRPKLGRSLLTRLSPRPVAWPCEAERERRRHLRSLSLPYRVRTVRIARGWRAVHRRSRSRATGRTYGVAR